MKKILSEKNLIETISKTVTSVLLEDARSLMQFGVKGGIPCHQAIDLVDDVSKDVLDMCDSGKRSIPPSMIGDDRFFGKSTVLKVYKQYADAISRRSDLGRTPISFFLFLSRIRFGWKGNPMVYYEHNGDYLLGILNSGVFMTVYLCPQNAGMGLFKFIRDVCQYNNVVFAVTNDMADMLERLGCPKYNGEVEAKFRGHMQSKSVYGSTQEAADKGAEILGLFKKVGDMKGSLEGIMRKNPRLRELIAANATLAHQLISNPDVIKALNDHPDIIDKLLNNLKNL